MLAVLFMITYRRIIDSHTGRPSTSYDSHLSLFICLLVSRMKEIHYQRVDIKEKLKILSSTYDC